MQKQLSIQENQLNEQILKLCHSMEISLHDNHKGPKIYTNYQRIALIILYVRSKKSLVNFLLELRETKWISWLGLKEIPCDSTLNNWVKKFDLNFVRKLVSNQLKSQKPKMMAIDATGIDSWKRSRHYEKRMREFGHKEHMPYSKLDVIVDVDNMLIHDWVLRIKPRHDTLGAESIFRRMKLKDILILADKGYDSEPLHKLVRKMGNLLFAPVRNFKEIPRGFNRKRCAKGNENYSMRNTAESVIHALKCMKNELRSKINYQKKREMGWTVLVYNMIKMIEISKTLFYFYFKSLFWI